MILTHPLFIDRPLKRRRRRITAPSCPRTSTTRPRQSPSVDVMRVRASFFELAFMTPAVGGEGAVADLGERGDFGCHFAGGLPHSEGWVRVHE